MTIFNEELTGSGFRNDLQELIELVAEDYTCNASTMLYLMRNGGVVAVSNDRLVLMFAKIHVFNMDGVANVTINRESITVTARGGAHVTEVHTFKGNAK